MVEADKIIDSLAADSRLVLQFFAVFSRFEFALKRFESFRKTGKKAEPNWDKYANSLKGCFVNVKDKSFQDALTFLKNNPPQRQVVSNNVLAWAPTEQNKNDHDEAYVLHLVRIVRNNLFHGGKYPHGSVEDVARNPRLLEAAITILSQCLKLSKDVRDAFNEGINDDSARQGS